MIKVGMIEKTLSGLVIGAIAGGSYGLLRGFLSQPGYAERLTPRPECFDMDADAAKLFHDLATYRFYDEEAYQEAMHNIDSLLCLEKQLLLKEVDPAITDPPTATQYGMRAFKHLRTLNGKIPEDAIYEQVKSIIKQLERVAENHVHNVDLLCRNVT